MFRLVSILLLLICSLSIASTAVQGDRFQKGAGQSTLTSFSEAQDHESNCDDSDGCDSHSRACRQCHLGHCSFLVESGTHALGPIGFITETSSSTFSYSDVTLVLLTEPPSA